MNQDDAGRELPRLRQDRRVRSRLLAWYRKHRRDLPWRRTRDPYAIWISEAMLQQTRVETVIPYWEKFLGRFPDVASLAASDLDDVLGHWAGLGYYSRARNLRTAAQELTRRHAGRLPEDVETLRSLPGIGRYTAGAVASIAFDRPEPVVDGNVARVLCRWLGVREDPRSPAVQRGLWEEAGRLVRGRNPGDLNQALMELGALVCTPRSPDCKHCPVSTTCAAWESGDPESIPLRAPRSEPPTVRLAVGLVRRNEKLLAVRRPPTGLFGGLWELPGGEIPSREKAATGLTNRLREATGLELEAVVPLGRVEHRLTHRRLQIQVFSAEAAPGRVRCRGFDAHRWVSLDGLRKLPQATVTRKVLRVALDGTRV